MAHVIVLDSVNEDIFVCGLCKSVFNSLELFLDHKRIKCVLNNVGCVITDQSVYSKTSSVYKSSEVAPEANDTTPQVESTEIPSETFVNELTCTICKKKFKNKKGLLAHTKSHYMKPFQCLVCGRCFIQNSHLQRHILSHKVWPESLSETTPKSPDMELLSFSCPYCTVMFSNYNKFRSHLKNHQSFKKYKCIQGDCKDFYDTFESLLHHVASSHITQLYTCHICNESFHTLEDIGSHELSHNDFGKDSIQTKQYKCTQCDAVFTKPEKLSLHKLTESHKKECIHCKKTFASDKRLRLHLQIHRNLKPFQCNICNLSFHMKKYLTSHMLKHGSKTFKCSVCRCMFNRSDVLKRHMQSHNSIKMFTCPYKDTLNCKKEFSRKDKLKQHIQCHTSKVVEGNSQENIKNNDLNESYNDEIGLSSNIEKE